MKKKKKKLSRNPLAVKALARYYEYYRNLLPKTQARIKEVTRFSRTGLKQCKDCSEFLEAEDFYTNSALRDGLSKNCRTCHSVKMLENYYRKRI